MYEQKKPIENTYLVRERDRERFRELLAVLMLGIPLGIFLLLFAWQNIEVIRLGREATRLETTRRDLEDSNRKLSLEIERRTALRGVEARAEKLGLRPAGPSERVFVETGAPSRSIATASEVRR